MDDYYPAFRALHVGAVIASGSLFLLRALALNLAGAAWPLRRPVRSLAYVVDSALLAAAIALAAIIGQYPFANAWLTAKLLLLILYIVLGYRALRAPTRVSRLICLAGAAATFLFIVSVARAHDPLGIFAQA
jgi:uncharacterized membrane protein SirB2